ncbi:glycine--tRNA ligase [Candidatus Shapirobacteria bacterium]|nr:MAG: glycine--tRNA ligase [Candidatus Shapirobacteria bacterium]
MVNKKQSDLVKKIVSLCKRRGIVFQNSEIYGGLAGFYDYGPIGSLTKYNLKNLWWKTFVLDRSDVVGIDGTIITHPQVWHASGHVKNFNDQLAECKKCHHRFRTDFITDNKCPDCGGPLTEGRTYNILFETSIGVVEGEKTKAYLRGEACQNIYLNFKNVADSTRIKVPFGIAQIGKAFRNEVNPKNFLYRVREFEQWDIEYFVHPDQMDKWYEYWKQTKLNWYQSLVNNSKKIRLRQHTQDELVFYAKKAFDVEYQAPWGWSEWEGIHWRADYDLSQHSKFSHQDLSYTDPITHQKYIPHIVETSGGVDRTFFYLLLDAYQEEQLDNGQTRTYLKLDPRISAYKICVIPLASNKEKLVNQAKQIYQQLQKRYSVDWDDSSNIGKKYRRQDEIGTPWCLVVDYQSLEDQTVTIRNRDDMSQIRIDQNKVDQWLTKQLQKN